MGVSFIGPTLAYNNSALTGVTAVQSKSYDIRRYAACAFQAVYDGTLEATFQVLGSNDNVNFDDTGVFVKASTGSSGNSLVNLAQTGYSYVLFQITPSAGTSSVVVNFTAKEG